MPHKTCRDPAAHGQQLLHNNAKPQALGNHGGSFKGTGKGLSKFVEIYEETSNYGYHDVPNDHQGHEALESMHMQHPSVNAHPGFAFRVDG